jgi:hypothetical protein
LRVSAEAVAAASTLQVRPKQLPLHMPLGQWTQRSSACVVIGFNIQHLPGDYTGFAWPSCFTTLDGEYGAVVSVFM